MKYSYYMFFLIIFFSFSGLNAQKDIQNQQKIFIHSEEIIFGEAVNIISNEIQRELHLKNYVFVDNDSIADWTLLVQIEAFSMHKDSIHSTDGRFMDTYYSEIRGSILLFESEQNIAIYSENIHLNDSYNVYYYINSDIPANPYKNAALEALNNFTPSKTAKEIHRQIKKYTH